MSNFRAVATVTSALRTRLLQVVQTDVPGAEVTTVRPVEAGTQGAPNVGVNIFLYQVNLNGALRNVDAPTRRPDGTFVEQPQLPLDLDYLISFYGDMTTLQPQRLLASTMRSLHARPWLTRAMIEAVEGSPASNLAEQVDRVKFTPLSLSLEDLCKLWSVLFQTAYVLSIAYRASVVLIEPELQPQPALPVRDFNVYGIPLRQPVVRQIVAQAGPEQPILPERQVAIAGERLRGDQTRVLIDGQEAVPDQVADTGVVVTLPAGLRAGPHGVQIRHLLLMGTPAVAHRGVASNLAAFVLHPVITQTAGAYDITVANVQGSGSQPRSATVGVTIEPAAETAQTATLELLSTDGDVRTFFAEARVADTDELSFQVSGLAPGDYLVRVRIDGAESPFEIDTEPTSPTFRRPIAPMINLP